MLHAVGIICRLACSIFRMASVAMLIGGAVVNAVAFSGSNYLFSMFRDRGVDEERLRHDKAVEQLNAAHEAWSRRRTERLDWLNTEIQRENHAAETFRDVDAAMQQYSRIFGSDKAASVMDGMREPVLSDFYTPSDDHKNRELIFITLGVVAFGTAVYWYTGSQHLRRSSGR